ncbi:MAG: hypothetical protein ABR57_02565 [Acidimicrobium sp. BACL17 MAG-120924-bin0]|jgi:hypothetical protein|nr:MAG: hypothetical protein ABR57_02565 [Acidimicrobium sp. BACL17 MAG-120924-bin0]
MKMLEKSLTTESVVADSVLTADSTSSLATVVVVDATEVDGFDNEGKVKSFEVFPHELVHSASAQRYDTQRKIMDMSASADSSVPNVVS